jgi:hypothetical protein
MSLILSGTDGVADVDGSAATPAIRGTDANTGIFFPAADTIAFAEGGAEVARFDSSGNLGIGTTSPTDNLDVVGTETASNVGVLVRNLATTSNSNAVFGLRGNNNTVRANFLVDGLGTVFGTGSILYTETNHPLLFGTNSTERARIDSSGNLLVGTTSFGAAGRVTTESASVNGNFISNNTAGSGTRYHCVFYENGTERGSITSNGSTTSYVTSSDYRLKEDIAPMTGALAKVTALKPVTYKWKSTGEAGEGFIAHELAEVCSDAVIGEKDAVNEDGSIKSQGIDTSFLVATLTAAIQEQQALITALTARVEALEGAKP